MGVLFSFWQRVESNRHVRKVTGSKITAFYALLSVTYCALQILFLVASWQVNHTAGNILETIVTTSGNGSSQFTYVENRDGQPTLFLCEDGLRQTTACKVIVPVPPRPINSGVSPTSGAVPPIKVKRSNVEYRHLETGELNTIGISEIRVNGQPFTEGVETLSPLCVNALKWPYHHLLMVRREDIVSVTYQAWLLLMSGVAIFNESIPHIGASFIVHIIALFWSSYQIYTAQKFGQDYRALIVNGACDGVDLIAEYFSFRTGYQIAATVINFVSLIASGYLTWRLFGAYGWATFKKMGASISIARAYKAALGLSIGVQLSIFFYMASVGLWVDTIRKKLMGADPDFRTLYLVGYTIMTILTLPWMYLAWYGIRRESARLMYSFYFTSVLYLGFSGAMFKSTTFKGFFIRWPFVAVIFSFSVFLVVITIALSVICQLNFGKGLPHYFERRNGEDPEDFNSDFHPSPDEKNDDLEKVAFPSDNVSVSFPSSTASLPRLERHGTAGSYSSVESYGSTRLPPMQLTDVPRLAIPGNEHGRSLTASSTTTSTDSPSWTPGDDKHMMVARPSPAAKGANLQRFDSASSFGQLDSGKFDRDFSFRTTSSASGPGRSPNSPNSKNPVNPFSNANQLGRKRTVDLGNEL